MIIKNRSYKYIKQSHYFFLTKKVLFILLKYFFKYIKIRRKRGEKIEEEKRGDEEYDNHLYLQFFYFFQETMHK